MRDHRDSRQGTRDHQLALPLKPVCAHCGKPVEEGRFICLPCKQAPMSPGEGSRILARLDTWFHEEFRVE